MVKEWKTLMFPFLLGGLLIAIGMNFGETYELYNQWEDEIAIKPGYVFMEEWKLAKDVLFEVNATVECGNRSVVLYAVEKASGREIKGGGLYLHFKTSKEGIYQIFYDNSQSSLLPAKLLVVRRVYLIKHSTFSALLIGIGSALLIVIGPFFAFKRSKVLQKRFKRRDEL
ncbi:hypothetical protein ADU37_CDS08190 [Thermococcus sp. 2319x1]|uniref:hypothetical protein n=1 Tax=Thermococcus sp. 2319x1 TaxID=1674923 RepID=UPI00073AE1D0|nr:hypothetical protein [Thermococcus sp. 2319x1]ALV62518.1 hypothetical protein ADU37_CDS08190 [Thermococcus sp. 2319x1]